MSKVIRQSTGVAEKLKEALAIDKLETKVGWLDGAKYEDGTPVAYVATVQEFGDPKINIPPRSFMRTTAAEKKRAWADLASSGARSIIAGKSTARNVMDGLGQAAEGDIRKKISQIQSPPLKQSTIESRARKLADGKTVGNLTKPLVESAIMINSLSSTVEQK